MRNENLERGKRDLKECKMTLPLQLTFHVRRKAVVTSIFQTAEMNINVSHRYSLCPSTKVSFSESAVFKSFLMITTSQYGLQKMDHFSRSFSIVDTETNFMLQIYMV